MKAAAPVHRRWEALSVSAEDFLPEKYEYPSLKKAAAGCRGCPLFKRATQTVFGEGSLRAKVFLVGEQPGDQEDKAGRPFVGPAGRIMEKALLEAGLERSEIYVTNVVKHFKWRPQGDKRIHEKPDSAEIAACKPWLKAELELIQPEILVCLGVTAAEAVLDRKVTIKRERGRFFRTDFSAATYVTVHPSSLLRQPDSESRRKAYREFLADMKKVRRRLEM
ncbi:MAG TPA: UdgX family uracil-DNA binding protein [bacterium]|nr:UdgX family uracil-DNA binding protein [bacterium]